MKLFFGNTSFEIINIKAKEIKKSQTTLIFYDLKLKKILNIIDEFYHKLNSKRQIIFYVKDKKSVKEGIIKHYDIIKAAGLAHLGEDFQFQTIFGYIGKLENNELRGDIVIKGEGDPSFMSQPESQIFERWVNVLKKQNIHRILGNIIADATIFEEQAIADTWFWEDIGNWYAGGTTGLNIFNNLYTVNFSPTKSVNFSPYQEFLIRQKYSKINTVNRFRLESRFFRTVVDGRITNDSRFNFRFRYQFILTIPLFKLFGRQVGLRLGNELFINAGRTITYNIFDRNNLLLGGSIHLSKNITAILTYNGQFLAFNRPAAYTYRHILWFIVSHKIDFTKKKEE